MPQAGQGFAPGGVHVKSHPDPPDEPLGPLRGPGEGGVDEVPHDRREGGIRLGPALLLFGLHLVAQPAGLFDVLLQEEQQVVGEAFEDRMALLGFLGIWPMTRARSSCS